MGTTLLAHLACLALAPVHAQEQGSLVDLLRSAAEDFDAALGEGDMESARLLVEEAGDHVLEVGRPATEEETDLLSRLADAAELVSLLHPALLFRERIVKGLESRVPADHPDLLAARANLAVRLWETGDLPAARKIEEDVLRVYERTLPEDHPTLLRARQSLAVTMAEMGDVVGAHGLEKSVLAAYERSLPADHPDLIDARHNLAVTVAQMGDLPAARALQEAVLAARERSLPEDHPDLLHARQNLAGTMGDLGDLQGARALYESVLAARQRTLPDDHPDLLHARQNLAVTMADLGDLHGARDLEEDVLQAYERTLPADHFDLLLARQNLAVTMAEMGDFRSARALEETVLAVRARSLPADHPALLRARQNLAVTMKAMGDLEGARALEEAVLASRQEALPEGHPDLLRSRENLAVTLRAAGDLQGARRIQEAVLAVREQALPPDHPDLLYARRILAVTLRSMGDRAGARALVPELVAGLRGRVLSFLVLAPGEARGALETARGALELLLFLSESEQELEGQVFELFETMRMVAGEAARAVRSSRDLEVAALTARSRAVRAKIGDLASASPGREPGEVSSELTRLVHERNGLEREASRRLVARGVAMQPVELSSLAGALPPGGAAVGYRRVGRWYQEEHSSAFQRGGDHVLAHVLRHDGSLERVDLGPAGELEELVLAWRRELGRPLHGRGVAVREEAQPAGEDATGELLRKRLVDPLLAVLGQETKTLHVCADDLVFLVPLDALPLKEGSVGDRYQVVNEVSFSRLLADRTSKLGGASLLLLGDADYDDRSRGTRDVLARAEGELRSGSASFTRLPGTRGEVSALAERFEETFEAAPVLLTGNGATKEALAAFVEGKRFVHIATHGWFAPETIRSQLDDQPGEDGWERMGLEERVTGMAPMLLCGLALAGANQGRDPLGRMPGLLTAEELSSFDLSACELAVLSACETNVGIRRAGQGIQSLQAALYSAGARSSVTSLWKVDDAATRRLMELFYNALWEQKKPKAKALWEAKRVLRDEGAPVRDWGGWVLTGHPH